MTDALLDIVDGDTEVGDEELDGPDLAEDEWGCMLGPVGEGATWRA